MINPLEYKPYIINKTSSMRSFITKLDKKGAILPVILLEATVTGGRTYQAYKRDGFVEARERVTEESLGAIFWLFGATVAGKIFDKIGQKMGKVPKTMPAVGRDAARTPFTNYMEKITKMLNLSPEKAERIKTNLARYSVGKTAASILTACLFIGYIVPKMNQAITKNIFGKMKKNDPNHKKAPDPTKTKLTIKDARAVFGAKAVALNAVENFKARSEFETKTIQYTEQNNTPSFKGGADSLLRIVQNFEENAVWKLLGTDVGTVTGRTANARNNDERVEIAFRDISSIYFYCFSMPAIVAFMNRKDSLGGLNTKLNPMSSMEVHNYLVEKMAQNNQKSMNPQAFKEFALGNENYDKALYEKIFQPKPQEAPKKIFFGLITKKPQKVYEKIALDDFNKIVDTNVKDNSELTRLKTWAKEMSQMQPQKIVEKDGKKVATSILTESQVKDILMGGEIRKPAFLKQILNHIFEDHIVKPENYDATKGWTPLKKGTKQLTNPLQNSYRYISLADIEDRHDRIINYVKAIAKDAETNKTNVEWSRMLELNKRNLRKNGLFMALAMGVSSLFLSTIIPKVQYYITFLRTGKNTFPGVEDMEEKK